jgi:hypothetical protein
MVFPGDGVREEAWNLRGGSKDPRERRVQSVLTPCLLTDRVPTLFSHSPSLHILMRQVISDRFQMHRYPLWYV